MQFKKQNFHQSINTKQQKIKSCDLSLAAHKDVVAKWEGQSAEGKSVCKPKHIIKVYMLVLSQTYLAESNLAHGYLGIPLI
jgi:hypothetical protein